MFKVDIIGRVDKMRITKNDILLPLYEAIVNSFQSIEELNEINDDKQIAINILRDMRQEPLENKDKEENYPIIGFIIRDNGIGFNDKNYGMGHINLQYGYRHVEQIMEEIDNGHENNRALSSIFYSKKFT